MKKVSTTLILLLILLTVVYATTAVFVQSGVALIKGQGIITFAHPMANTNYDLRLSSYIPHVTYTEIGRSVDTVEILIKDSRTHVKLPNPIAVKWEIWK